MALSCITYAQCWEEKYLVHRDRESFDQFGYALAMDEKTAAIALPASSYFGVPRIGAVEIFEKNTLGLWEAVQRINSPHAQDPELLFGNRIELDNDKLIVATHTQFVRFDTAPHIQRGSAIIYEKIDNEWIYKTEFYGDLQRNHSRFAHDVDISGDWAVVGASNEEFNPDSGYSIYGAGAAYIYHRNALGEWKNYQKINAPSPSLERQFGKRVAIDGSNIVIACDRGSVETYRLKDSIWVYNSSIRETFSTNRFGSDIAMSDSKLIIGAEHDYFDAANLKLTEKAGAVYVYEISAKGHFSFSQKLVHIDRKELDLFGRSVAIHGDNILVGAVGTKLSHTATEQFDPKGSAFLFLLNSENHWELEKEFVAGYRSWDYYGVDVACNGEDILVGAYLRSFDDNPSGKLSQVGNAHWYRQIQQWKCSKEPCREPVPNPNNGTFKLLEISHGDIELYDQLGRPVPFNIIGNDVQIESLKSGIYFLRNGVCGHQIFKAE